MPTGKRATVHFDERLHKALWLKIAETEQRVSDLVDTAVRNTLAEDAEDLQAFRDRINDPTLALDDLIRDSANGHKARRASARLG